MISRIIGWFRARRRVTVVIRDAETRSGLKMHFVTVQGYPVQISVVLDELGEIGNPLTTRHTSETIEAERKEVT